MDRKEKLTKDELVKMRIIPLRLLLQEIGANQETIKSIRVFRRKIKSRGYARTYRHKTKLLMKEKENLMNEKKELEREINMMYYMMRQ